MLKGHKKEVCCKSVIHSTPRPTFSLFFSAFELTIPFWALSYSRHMAPYPPLASLWRVRRFHPALGPLLILGPSSLPACIHPSGSTRHSLTSTRLQRLVTHLPPSRPHSCQCLKRPHHPVLVPRASWRRFIGLLRWRGETTGRCGRWRTGRGRGRFCLAWVQLPTWDGPGCTGVERCERRGWWVWCVRARG